MQFSQSLKLEAQSRSTARIYLAGIVEMCKCMFKFVQLHVHLAGKYLCFSRLWLLSERSTQSRLSFNVAFFTWLCTVPQDQIREQIIHNGIVGSSLLLRS